MNKVELKVEFWGMEMKGKKKNVNDESSM